MDKRTMVAIGLSLVVWVGYMFFFADTNTPAPQPAASSQVSSNASAGASSAAAAKSDAVQKKGASVAVVNGAKAESFTVKTAYYNAVLSGKGAKIESIKYGARQIELAGVEVQGSKGLLDFTPLFAEKEIIEGSALTQAVWTGKKLSETQIVFAAQAKVNGKPVTIEKKYSFSDKNPSFDLSIRIINDGKDTLTFENSSFILTPGDSLGPKMDEYESIYNQIGQIFYADGSLERGDRGSGVFSSETETKSFSKTDVHWFGIISRYFALVVIPQEVKSKNLVWDSRGTGSHRIGAYIPADAVAPRASIEKKFRVCIAEKEKDVLSKVDPGIIPAMDVSKWIEPLRNGILFLLIWINKLFGNFGVSIIILSIITKLVFLPLTIKSTESMKRMTMLQPKLAELKEKYKDQPEKIQKATVELYRKYKVNPLGGCLPILIQMPFFIALYSALSTSFGLWHSPFMLWISDLSAPDTAFTVSGFNVNILPLLWAGTTFLQQKMTPTPTASGGQQWIMKLMPLMLLFIFWTMPSGLTLYWTIQNALQIAHQYYVNKFKKTAEAALD